MRKKKKPAGGNRRGSAGEVGATSGDRIPRFARAGMGESGGPDLSAGAPSEARGAGGGPALVVPQRSNHGGRNSGLGPFAGSIGLDTVTVTVWDVRAAVVRWAGSLMGIRPDQFIEQGYGRNGYRGVAVGPLGAQVWHDPAASEDVRCTVFLASTAMEVVGTLGLVVGLMKLGCRWNVTRADVALDGVLVHPDEVERVWRFDEAVRCRSKRSSNGRQENEDGVTVYIGKRSSHRFMRVYNRRGPTRSHSRFELECKDDRAREVVAGLMSRVPEEWPAFLRGVLFDFIDFKQGWWAEAMAGMIELRRANGSAVELTIEAKTRWLESQVAGTLSDVVEAAGGDLGVVERLVMLGAMKRRRQMVRVH